MLQVVLLLQVIASGPTTRSLLDANGDLIVSYDGQFTPTERWITSAVGRRCRALVRDSAMVIASAPSAGAVLTGCRIWNTSGAVEIGSPEFKGPIRHHHDATTIWLAAVDQLPGDTLVAPLLLDASRALAISDANTTQPVASERRDRLRALLGELDIRVRDRLGEGIRSYRACTGVAFALGDHAGAHDCSTRALGSGADSTWHLTRLAWLARARGDLLAAERWLRTAVVAAHIPADRAEVGWHLLASETGTPGPLPPDSASRQRLSARLDSIVATKRVWLELPDSSLADWLSAQDPPARGHPRWHPLAEVTATHLARVVPIGGRFVRCESLPCLPSIAEPRVDRIRLWSAAGTEVCLYLLRPERSAVASGKGTMRVRQWDPAQQLVSEVAGALQPLGGGAAAAVVPCVAAQGSWSVAYGADHGRPVREYLEGPSAIPQAALALSDLVFGIGDSSITMASLDRVLPLPWGRSVARGTALRLYYQARSPVARDRVATEWSLLALDKRGEPKGAPVVVITQSGAMEAGVTVVDRVLDLAKLEKGRYRVLVTVRDIDSGESATVHRDLEVN